MVLTFEFVDKILKSDYSNKSYRVVQVSAVCFSKFRKIQFESFDEICTVLVVELTNNQGSTRETKRTNDIFKTNDIIKHPVRTIIVSWAICR